MCIVAGSIVVSVVYEEVFGAACRVVGGFVGGCDCVSVVVCCAADAL